jgi:hypothetical protein
LLNWLPAFGMIAAARVHTSEVWRDVKEMTLDEILEEMDELLAELTGLVMTPRPDTPT